MILFKEIFREPILDGTKTETRRLGKRRWKVGSVHIATTNRFKVDARFAALLVQEVEEERIGDITEAGAHREGFTSRKAFLEYFYQLNKSRLPALGWEDEYCWRVRFKRLPEWGDVGVKT